MDKNEIASVRDANGLADPATTALRQSGQRGPEHTNSTPLRHIAHLLSSVGGLRGGVDKLGPDATPVIWAQVFTGDGTVRSALDGGAMYCRDGATASAPVADDCLSDPNGLRKQSDTTTRFNSSCECIHVPRISRTLFSCQHACDFERWHKHRHGHTGKSTENSAQGARMDAGAAREGCGGNSACGREYRERRERWQGKHRSAQRGSWGPP